MEALNRGAKLLTAMKVKEIIEQKCGLYNASSTAAKDII